MITPCCSLARLIVQLTVSFLISLSTSWTRMSYEPYRRAKERHRAQPLNVIDVGPSQIHRGLSQMQRLKPPMVKSAETTRPTSKGGRILCFRSMLKLSEWISSKASATFSQPWRHCPKAQGQICSHKPIKFPPVKQATGRLTHGSMCKPY